MPEKFPAYPIDRNAVLRAAHRRTIPALGDSERPTVVCAAGVHVWDRRDENAPIEPGDPCKKCLYNRVLCEAHTGIHAERADCRWPHYVAPSGPAPVIFDESGSLIEPPL